MDHIKLKPSYLSVLSFFFSEVLPQADTLNELNPWNRVLLWS